MTDLSAMLVPALGAVLLGFLWQGAVIGLLAWLALILLRNARPQARYAVACVALLACVLAPASQLMRAFGDGGGATVLQVDTLHATNEPASSTPSPVASMFDALPSPPDAALPWFVALWAAGAGVLALRMACGLLWVRRLRNGSMPCGGNDWQARLDRLARRMGLHRMVALRIVADGDSPLSAGWWKPVVLVPAALALRMPAPLLEALLAHELAHIRRHDYLVNLLQGAVEVVLFYHPVVWWLSRRIRVEREQVADDIAASVLGEPRRLAVALSELDRYAVPFPAFAQAAHGGQLMSRIQQLVRPDRRAVGGIVALPLVGLVAAGIAFYAQARVTSVSITHTPPTTTGVAMLATPVAQAGPVTRSPDDTAQPDSATRVSLRDEERPTYAFVRKDREGITMSGDLDDVDEIRAARRSIDGDFIWFRRDSGAYVVRDAALLARAEAAWRPLQPLEARMKSLEARMQPHSEKLEVLGERMERLSDIAPHDDAMDAAAKEMEALGERQAALGERQAALAERMIRADEAQRDRLQREMEALDAQQSALGQQMERQGAVLEARSERMQEQHAPMEALGREMEAASKPMEAIGKQMEVLGKQIEQKANVADREIQALIDEAVARDLAAPAPARQ